MKYTLLLLLFLVSCTPNENIDKLSINEIKFTRSFGICDSTSTYCVNIKINYPRIEDKNPVSASINSKLYGVVSNLVFIDSSFSSLDELADSLIEDYKRLKRDFPDSPYWYELERDVKVTLDTLSILSVLGFEYSYLGGAHPNTNYFCYIFNKKSGGILTLKDLFIEESLEKLNTIAEKYFRLERELKPDDNLTDAGFWFENGKFLLNSNFLFNNKNELVFYYNAYEIAAYAVGPTIVKIPIREIRELIKSEWGFGKM